MFLTIFWACGPVRNKIKGDGKEIIKEKLKMEMVLEELVMLIPKCYYTGMVLKYFSVAFFRF